ncbi:hypothetical protein Acr_03g0014480 [Actinidia rufa]|uniref:Uncharacterized protein n=1 Tax=Actinidia rufa TaxID=165716 RepID=A0A7J0EDV7_9ERIC|nr:hypothetical protein Acr_03g0014480 [Actinidia rufa]
METSVVIAYSRLRLLPPIADQMPFAASSGSGPRSYSDSSVLSFIQNYESKFLSGKGRVILALLLLRIHPLVMSRIYLIFSLRLANYSLSWVPYFSSHPSGSTVTLATGTVTAFHAKNGHPTWVLNSGANDHMTGTPSLPGPDATTIPANLNGLPRPIPLFDSPPVQVSPASYARAPLRVYTRRAPPSTSL